MKQSDIFSIILVASVGTLAAFFICQSIMGDPNKASVKFKALTEVVSQKLVDPDPEVFNSTAINPTVEVYVGDCEDVDQNGILDERELEICYGTQVQYQACSDFDYDQNGSLSEYEYRVCLNIRYDECKEYDEDKNEELSGEELEVCMKSKEEEESKDE